LLKFIYKKLEIKIKMRFSKLFKVVASVLLATKVAAEGDVKSLTKDDYEVTLESTPLALVKYFAPWCGHCKALAPEFAKAATALKEENILLAEVDCTVESDICNEVGVRGYPTLKVYRNGKPSDYKGQRTSESIISYMKKQNLPDLTAIKADEFEKFSTSDKVVVVGFVKEGSDEYKALEANAKELREQFVFGYIDNEELAKKAGSAVPGIVVYKQFDEGKAVLEGKITEESIKEFVKVESVPLMDELGPENYSKYMDSGLPLVYLFTTEAEDKKTIGAWCEAIAKKVQGKLNFVYIDAVKFTGHGKFLGLKENWPAIIIQDVKQNTKFPYPQDKKIEKEALEKFIEDFQAGKLEPYVKSQDIPEKQEDGIFNVVAKTFEDVVLDKSKDVLLLLYAPWCGHCKKLAPTYKEIAEAINETNDKLLIARMDATENDIPPTSPWNDLEGFPTVILFKADDKNTPVIYDGDRSKDSIIEFLKKNSVNEFKLAEPAKEEEKKEDEKKEDEKKEEKKEEEKKEEKKEKDEL
jgi:protein disulfide-isomerase A1